MYNKKKILLLGSGLMAETVVSYLVKKSNHVHIASNIISDAQKISNKYSQDTTFSQVDVLDQKSLGPLIQNSDIVISYIPAFLHIYPARLCLKYQKNLVTASYVSKQMKELNEEVIAKGLIFLNQMGLDPGIDHMSTMKIINQVHQKNGKILQYQSWCGGLPSPQCCDNPLGYKFTWSPIGALRAVKNSAKYILNGKQYQVDQKDLLYSMKYINVNPALELQGYPNRDSLLYKQIYGLKQTEKVLRGTLRYKGFCTIINSFKQIGLFTQEKIDLKTWVEYLQKLLQNQQVSEFDKSLIEDQSLHSLCGKIIERTINKIKHYQNLNQEQKNTKSKQILKAFKFFGLLNANTKIQKPGSTNLQNLVALLQKKLKLNQGETDLIVMSHVFKIQYPNQKPYSKYSSLIKIGQRDGASGMSTTVGKPTAIGAQLILQNRINCKGVVTPVIKQIYDPVLEQLKKEGIYMRQYDDI